MEFFRVLMPFNMRSRKSPVKKAEKQPCNTMIIKVNDRIFDRRDFETEELWRDAINKETWGDKYEDIETKHRRASAGESFASRAFGGNKHKDSDKSDNAQ